MDYGKLIRRAWEITWRYKFLWVFGIAMAFCRAGSGVGSNFNWNSRSLTNQNNFGQFLNPTNPMTKSIENFLSSGLLWFLLGLLIVLIVVFFVLGIAVVAYARGSLIRSVHLLENGETLDFRRAWAEGKGTFRRLFGMEVLLNIPGLLIGLTIILLVVLLLINLLRSSGMAYGGGQSAFLRILLTIAPAMVIFICSLACAALVVQLLIAILEVFGSRAIALEGMPVLAGLSRGWKLFLANLAPSIILAIILFVISFGIGLLISIPIALLIAVLMVFLMGVVHLAGAAWLVFVPIIALFVFVVAVLSSVVRGVFLVFSETLWTLAYRDFTRMEESITLTP